MKKAGCKYMLIGLESGSDKILKNMKKGAKIEDYESGLKIIKEQNIWVHANFIFGFPGETLNEFRETLKFVWHNEKFMDNIHYEAFSTLPILERRFNKYELKSIDIKHDNKGNIKSANISIEEAIFNSIFFNYENNLENYMLLLKNHISFKNKYNLGFKKRSLILDNIAYMVTEKEKKILNLTDARVLIIESTNQNLILKKLRNNLDKAYILIRNSISKKTQNNAINFINKISKIQNESCKIIVNCPPNLIKKTKNIENIIICDFFDFDKTIKKVS